MKLYTLTQVAARLGKHKSRVSRIAAKYGLGHRQGRELLLNRSEIAVLRAHFANARPGNPSLRDEAGRFLSAAQDAADE